LDDQETVGLKADLLKVMRRQGWKADDDPFPLSIVHNKGNAKLGDGFVNIIFSIAKTLCQQKATGLKVADSVLSMAYRKSKLSKHLKLKGNKDILGDKVEALLLWTWLNDHMDIVKMTSILRDNLDPAFLKHHEMEKIASVTAFTALFDAIAEATYTE